MTMRTVLTTTLCTPPPRTGSEMTGSVSFTIMFARRSVTRSRCPFLRMGLILLAYSFCFLRGAAPNGNEMRMTVAITVAVSHNLELVARKPGVWREGTHGVPLTLSTFSCVSSRLI